MGIQRLHQKFDTYFNGVNSKNFLSYTPEEKDLLFYQTSFALIEEIRQIRKNSIVGNDDNFSQQELISLFRVEKEIVTKQKNSRTSYISLPLNYLSFENALVDVKYNCGNFLDKDSDEIKYITIIDLGSFKKPSDFSVEIRDDLNVIYSSRNTRNLEFYSNLQSDLENYKTYAIAPMLDALSKSDYECYYEVFEDNFYENSLIIVTNAPKTITYDKNGMLSKHTSFASTYSKYKGSLTERKLRIVPVEKVNAMIDSYYGKSSNISPFGYISNNRLVMTVDSTFTVEKVKLSYIRKPDFPNFYLGKSLISGLPSLVERFEDTLLNYLGKQIPNHLINK